MVCGTSALQKFTSSITENSFPLCSYEELPGSLKIIIYKTIIFLVVLYVCEFWSVTLREEHRLMMFENRVLRIFGPKRDELTGRWRKLHNEELHDSYSSPSIIRIIKSKMRWVGHVARMVRTTTRIGYRWETDH
jgi:hypothetical protein